MKTRATFLACALLLAACTGNGVNNNGVSLGLGLGGMFGNHVGLGTSVNIPLGGNKTTTEVANLEQPILYFDANGQSSDSATKGGFFRKVLTKQNDGTYVVQDFYEMGGAKRTDPMQLTSAQLQTFRAVPQNGTLTVYAINGTIMQQQTFQNGKLIK